MSSNCLTMEDRLQIEELIARYNQLCDSGYDADELANLFVPDASMEVYDIAGNPDWGGTFANRDEIRGLYQRQAASGVGAVHLTFNSILEAIDAGTARGTSTNLTILVNGKGTPAESMRLRASFREDLFVRYADRWMFQKRVNRAILDKAGFSLRDFAALP